MANKVIGLVQARMGSKRLPGKVMAPLAERPLISHIFDRLRTLDMLSGVVLATTTDKRNDPLVEFAGLEGVDVYRSPIEDDIAERLYASALKLEADAILKVNGDCPFVDPEILGTALREFKIRKVDYVSNKKPMTWPAGLSCEVISFSALKWANENLSSEGDRELAATIISERSDASVFNIVGGVNPFHCDLTIDTIEDYVFAKQIFDELYPKNQQFSYFDVLTWMGDNYMKLQGATSSS